MAPALPHWLDVPTSLILSCWIGFYLYWVVSARGLKRTAQRQTIGDSLLYRTLTFVGALLLFALHLRRSLDIRVLPFGPATQYGGAVVCILGLALAVWARRTLGSNWSSMVTLKQEHELVERGPYRCVRHPIYTSILLMALGSAISFGRLVPFLGLVPFFLGFWVKLRQEEQLMLRHFPEAYPGYRKRVRALVPYLL